MSEHETPETPQPHDPAAADSAADAVPTPPPAPPAPSDGPDAPPPAPPAAPDGSEYVPGGHALPPADPRHAPGHASANAPGEPAPGLPDGQSAPGQPAPGQPAAGQEYGQPYGQPAPGQPYGQPAPGQPYGQPAPGQPYGQPAPGQPYGQPAPGQPYGQPGPGLPPAGPEIGPNKKLPLGALIGIIAAGVVVLLVIALAIIIPLAGRGGDAGGGSNGEPAPPAATPEEWVEEYLTALSEGDAETARKYVDTSSYSDALLTDEVLAASLELGAIDDIEVGEAEEGEYSDVVVPATFTVGGTEVTREFEMYQSEYDGDITMYNGGARISTYGFDDIGLTVNGVEISEDALVFPGMYEFATSLEEFTIEGETTLLVADEKSEEAASMLRPVLSETGVASFRELVTASLRECLAMKTLATPCGMDVTGLEQDGFSPVDGTVARALTAEGEASLAALVGEVSDRAVVSTYESFRTDITLEGQNAAGERGAFEVLFGAGMLSPKVDFAAETPQVVWE